MPSPAKKSVEATESTTALPEPLSDEDVVQRVLEGDVASFELIMRRYNQRLFRVAAALLERMLKRKISCRRLMSVLLIIFDSSKGGRCSRPG